MSVSFKSLTEAREARQKIVPEIQRLQNWLTGIATDDGGIPISSQNYQRKRGEVVTRLTQLQQRAGHIRDWIREHAEPGVGQHPNKVLLADLYKFLQRMEETEEIELLMSRIEEQVPMALLEATG